MDAEEEDANEYGLVSRLISNYVSHSIIAALLDETIKDPTTSGNLPVMHSSVTSAMAIEVENLAVMSETMSMNRGIPYLEILGMIMKRIKSEGGDLTEMDEDTFLAVWPSGGKNSHDRLHHAAQCAVDILRDVNEYITRAETSSKEDFPAQLRVKIGIGFGPTTFFHLGGRANQIQYVVTGRAIREALTSCTLAAPHEIAVVSKDTMAILDENFNATRKRDAVYVMDYNLACNHRLSPFVFDALVSRIQTLDEDALETLEMRLTYYVPGEIMSHITLDHDHQEIWANDVRPVTVVRIALALGCDEIRGDTQSLDDHMRRWHDVVVAIQDVCARYDGHLVDVTLGHTTSNAMCAFGLNPKQHADDALRGVLAAVGCVAALDDACATTADAVVASSECFAGSVGIPSCRRLVLLGRAVNLTDRMLRMRGADTERVVCDDATRRLVGDAITFRCVLRLNDESKMWSPIDTTTIGTAHRTVLNTLHRFRRQHLRRVQKSPLWASHEREEAKEIEACLERWVRATSERRASSRGTTQAIIVEGPIGSGKSVLVSHGLAQFRDTDKTQRGVIYTYADDFLNRAAFSGMANVVKEFLVGSHDHERDDAAQMKTLTQLLRDGRHDALVEALPLLAELLDLDVPADNATCREVSQSDDDTMRQATMRVLLYCVLVEIFRKYPLTVVAVDDALYMDEMSWVLLGDLMDGDASGIVSSYTTFPSCCADFLQHNAHVFVSFAVILSTRSVYLHEDLVSSGVLAEYDLLENRDDTCVVSMRKLDANGVRRGFLHHVREREHADARTLSDDALKTVMDLSDGNALFVYEIADVMLKERKLLFRDNGEVDIEESFRAVRDIPLPPRLHRMLGAELDRMDMTAQLLMKLLAVACRPCTSETLYAAFPLEHQKEYITDAVSDLMDRNMIVKTRLGMFFSSPFLFRVVRERLVRTLYLDLRRRLSETRQTIARGVPIDMPDAAMPKDVMRRTTWGFEGMQRSIEDRVKKRTSFRKTRSGMLVAELTKMTTLGAMLGANDNDDAALPTTTLMTEEKTSEEEERRFLASVAGRRRNTIEHLRLPTVTIGYDTSAHETEWGGAWSFIKLANTLSKQHTSINANRAQDTMSHHHQFVHLMASYLPAHTVSFLLNDHANVDREPDPTETLPCKSDVADAVVVVVDFGHLLHCLYRRVKREEGDTNVKRHELQHLPSQVMSDAGNVITSICLRHGGDVVQFAEHRVTLLWSPRRPASSSSSPETLSDRTTCAVKACMRICDVFDPTTTDVGLDTAPSDMVETLCDGSERTVSIGVATGTFSLIHIGDNADKALNRIECATTGRAAMDAQRAATFAHDRCHGGIAMSHDAWNAMRGTLMRGPREDRTTRTTEVDRAYGLRRDDVEALLTARTTSRATYPDAVNDMSEDALEESELDHKMSFYIPPPVQQCFPDPLRQHHSVPNEECWGNEIRFVSMIYVDTGVASETIVRSARNDRTGRDARQALQDAMMSVQHSLSKYLGEIVDVHNDEKKLVIRCGFGFPPRSHEDDELRAVMCAMDVCVQLERHGWQPRVGVSSGYAFCGVIGGGRVVGSASHVSRKSYHVHGDCVVMAKLLCEEASARGKMLFVDRDTVRAVHHVLDFHHAVTIKGGAMFSDDVAIEAHAPSTRRRRRRSRRMSHVATHVETSSSVPHRRTTRAPTDGARRDAALASERTLDEQMSLFWEKMAFHPAPCTSRAGTDEAKEIESAIHRVVAQYDVAETTLRKIMLLRGRTGVGKTTLVRHAAYKTGVQMIATFAPSFQHLKKYATFGNVVLAFLRGVMSCFDTASVQRGLREMLRADYPDLVKLLPALNKLLYVDFPTTSAWETIRAWEDEDERAQMTDASLRCLLLALTFKIVSHRRGRVVFVDDGLRMDECSWRLLNDMSDDAASIDSSYTIFPTEVLSFLRSRRPSFASIPFLVLIAMRPAEHNDHVIDHAIGPAINSVTSSARVVDLDAVTTYAASQIVLETLRDRDRGVTKCGVELMNFVRNATGLCNASFVKDVALELTRSGALRSAGDGVVNISAYRLRRRGRSWRSGGSRAHETIDDQIMKNDGERTLIVDVPRSMDRRASIWSDAFNLMEKIVVKTASFLPRREFTMKQLVRAFPLPDVSPEEIEENMERLADAPDLFVRTGHRAYRFRSAFMPRVWKKMMTPTQFRALERRAKKATKK